MFARRPLLTTATAASVLATAYYVSVPQKPLLMDSAQNPPTPTLSLPKNMLFSKQLKVTDVQQVNHDTKRITFELPGGKREVSGVTPGAAILTQHTPAGASFPVFRPYTPIHDLDQPGVLELLVKRYPNGRASSHLHSLGPGDELTVRGPLPGHWTTPKEPRDILCIAGGAGITPIYSLTKGILANRDDETRIQLLWGVNGTRDIVLKKELEELEQKYPDRLHVTYAVSGPEAAADASLGDQNKYRKGYIDETLLKEAIAVCESGAWGDSKGQKVFLCGPPKMEDAMAGKSGILTQLGLQKKEIHRF
jgi:cytochrome-b5 reductase